MLTHQTNGARGIRRLSRTVVSAPRPLDGWPPPPLRPYRAAAKFQSLAGTIHSWAGLVHSSAGLFHSSAGMIHSSAGLIHSSAGMIHSSAGLVHSSAGLFHSSAGKIHSRAAGGGGPVMSGRAAWKGVSAAPGVL